MSLTISDSEPRRQYTGNGVQTAFSANFEFRAASDVVCNVDGVVKTLNTDYTLTGAGVSGGGTLTFSVAPANGAIITIYRDMPIARTADQYASYGQIPAEVLEQDLDDITMKMQQLEVLLGRASRVSMVEAVTSSAMEWPEKTSRIGKYARWNSTTGALEAASELTAGTTLSQSTIGAALYPRTAAEIAVSVTPTSYAYPPGDLRRYGAALDGTTSDTAAWEKAISVAIQDGTEVFFPAGRSAVATGIDNLASRVKIRGAGNKNSILVVTAGSAITVFKAASLAAFNDGLVFEDFGILLTNSSDIGIDLSSCSRASLHRVRIWGDENQTLVRGTAVLFDASSASCYANTLIDCDIRNCVKGLHFRKAANANFVFGGQILVCTDNIYQAGATTERVDNCGFFGVRSEVGGGNALHITGDVWGWKFDNCRFEAYNAGDKCIFIENGDPALPPTVFDTCTVTVSGGATTYDLGSMTGRILITGQDANEYVSVSGTGTYHIGLGTLGVGSPSSSAGGTIRSEASSTDADLTLEAKGAGRVVTQNILLASSTPTGTGGQVSFGNTTATTVGAAGGASALPATPTGYLVIDIGGTKYKIPYYAN